MAKDHTNPEESLNVSAETLNQKEGYYANLLGQVEADLLQAEKRVVLLKTERDRIAGALALIKEIRPVAATQPDLKSLKDLSDGKETKD